MLVFDWKIEKGRRFRWAGCTPAETGGQAQGVLHRRIGARGRATRRSGRLDGAEPRPRLDRPFGHHGRRRSGHPFHRRARRRGHRSPGRGRGPADRRRLRLSRLPAHLKNFLSSWTRLACEPQIRDPGGRIPINKSLFGR